MTQSAMFSDPKPTLPAPVTAEVRAKVTTIQLSGRCLRVAHACDELVITTGYCGDAPTDALVGGIRIPAAAWPAVAAAAAALLEGGGI
jgi:hypothetical protein